MKGYKDRRERQANTKIKIRSYDSDKSWWLLTLKEFRALERKKGALSSYQLIEKLKKQSRILHYEIIDSRDFSKKGVWVLRDIRLSEFGLNHLSSFAYNSYKEK